MQSNQFATIIVWDRQNDRWLGSSSADRLAVQMETFNEKMEQTSTEYTWQFTLFLVVLIELILGREVLTGLALNGRLVEFCLVRCLFWGCYLFIAERHKRDYQRWPRLTKLGAFTLFLIILSGSCDVFALFRGLATHDS